MLNIFVCTCGRGRMRCWRQRLMTKYFNRMKRKKLRNPRKRNDGKCTICQAEMGRSTTIHACLQLDLITQKNISSHFGLNKVRLRQRSARRCHLVARVLCSISQIVSRQCPQFVECRQRKKSTQELESSILHCALTAAAPACVTTATTPAHAI